MASIPDYSNLKMNLSGLSQFFNDQGVKLSSQDSAKISSIFKECDTQNANGEKKADGELTGQERTTFLDKIKSSAPNLYQKVIDFYTAVDVVEDLQKTREETKKELEKIENENKTSDTEEKNKNDIRFGLG